MNMRMLQEQREEQFISSFGIKSANSVGRENFEEKCDIRTEFQRDRDRILHCKAFRRMKHKTQVFIAPEGDHYRTRLTHTLEVAQIARTISRALCLNEDLTEAIALGHDLGHTPFGHAGERALDQLCSTGFEHNKQSLRVVQRLEKDGKGLNLTWEVQDGILNHRTSGKPSTMEGKVVQLSDKIAYINHDVDDALRAGVLKEEEIPNYVITMMGKQSSKRINAMIRDTIKNSWGMNEIVMSSQMKSAVGQLRSFLFEKVYTSSSAEKEHRKAKNIIKSLYDYFLKNPYEMNNEFIMLMEQGEAVEQAVCDYIACMTDRFAIKKFSTLFIPEAWSVY